MAQWVRFLLWSSFLGPLCWMASPSYQRWLASVVQVTTGILGHRIRVDDLDVHAPLEVGIFVAMCLATARATRSRRVRALFIGVPVLVALEVGILIIASLPVILGTASSNAGPIVGDFIHYFLKTIVWANAGMVWFVLLAGREGIPAHFKESGSNPVSTVQRSKLRVRRRGAIQTREPHGARPLVHKNRRQIGSPS